MCKCFWCDDPAVGGYTVGPEVTYTLCEEHCEEFAQAMYGDSDLMAHATLVKWDGWELGCPSDVNRARIFDLRRAMCAQEA